MFCGVDGERFAPLQTMVLNRAADGSSRLVSLAGEVRLTPAAGGDGAEVQFTPRPPAQP